VAILIAEDDAHLRAGLIDLLTLEGYACVGAADGPEALAAFRRAKPDLCLFDVVMPGLDGLALLRTIRAENADVPIVLLSARGAEMDRVIGLELGADDYIAKPFSAREVLARIKGALRRVRSTESSNARVVMGDLIIDVKALRAYRGAGGIDLTKRELAILLALYNRTGQPVSRDDLFDIGWGRGFMPNSRALDQYVSALRRKIEIDPARPRIIQTVHGVGYRHDANPAAL
jgi:two-component system alkaline phosphatase synthesis response regulator PhoP